MIIVDLVNNKLGSLKMTLKKHIYGVLCASLIINYFTAPIAAPLIWHDVKQATSDRLIEMASELRPEKPTVIPAVTKEKMAAVNAMPEKIELSSLDDSRVDIIAQKLLEANQ